MDVLNQISSTSDLNKQCSRLQIYKTFLISAKKNLERLVDVEIRSLLLPTSMSTVPHANPVKTSQHDVVGKIERMFFF